MVVLEHEHARTRGHGDELGRRRDAVAYRRNQRDVLWAGMDQPRRRATRAFKLLVGKRPVDQPRLSLPRNTNATRLLSCNGQGTPRGGVEITNLARNIEQRTLRWQHRVPSVSGGKRK